MMLQISASSRNTERGGCITSTHGIITEMAGFCTTEAGDGLRWRQRVVSHSPELCL